MCQICEKVTPNLSIKEKEELLLEIGKALVKKRNEHFDEALDILLGTTQEPRDTYEESHWEEDYRNRDEK